ARTERTPGGAVPPLVLAHLHHDRAARGIVGRKPIEVPIEMALDLVLGLGEEAEAPAIAREAGNDAPGERSRVPEGIEHARARAELAQAVAAPREVVSLLRSGGLERRANRGI